MHTVIGMPRKQAIPAGIDWSSACCGQADQNADCVVLICRTCAGQSIVSVVQYNPIVWNGYPRLLHLITDRLKFLTHLSR